jgi:hypothetical protein
MHTEHLILLEKSIDLMILRGLFSYPQHVVTAKLIFNFYKGIFKEINTLQDTWEIENKRRSFESILVITKNKTGKSNIIIDGRNSENPTIIFQSGSLLNEKTLSFSTLGL